MDYDKQLAGAKVQEILKVIFKALDTLHAEHKCTATPLTRWCAICRMHQEFQAGLERVSNERNAVDLAHAEADRENG